MKNAPTLPRELAPGLVWTAGCLQYEYQNEEWHTHVSTFLLIGEEYTLLVDTGHPAHWKFISASLDEHLGDRQLDYVLPTHSEMPHAGNLPRLAKKYPGIRIVGEVRDYHLYYPELTERLDTASVGTAIELGGGRQLKILPAIWRDLPSTIWGYDTGTRTAFVADGFAYSHHHLAGECSLLSSELDGPPDVEQTMFVNERALFWTRHVDSESSSREVAQMFKDFPCDMVAPAHGSVIDNLDIMLPIMYEGMSAQRARANTEAVT